MYSEKQGQNIKQISLSRIVIYCVWSCHKMMEIKNTYSAFPGNSCMQPILFVLIKFWSASCVLQQSFYSFQIVSKNLLGMYLIIIIVIWKKGNKYDSMNWSLLIQKKLFLNNFSLLILLINKITRSRNTNNYLNLQSHLSKSIKQLHV